jgi:hypothetical protein
MARRRMIDPHFWESGDVAKLNIFTRFVLIGMFSKADDEGRGVGGAVYLRNTIFPYDDIGLADMKNALGEIQKRISIVFYEVDGNEYYQFLNWKKWQRVDKPKASILPPPPAENGQSPIPEQQEPVAPNESKNESENCSANDSGLNQKKGKEEKEKRISPRAGADQRYARESDVDDDRETLKLSSVGEYYESHIGNVSGRDREILDRLCLNYGEPEIREAVDKAVKNGGKSAAYVEKILKSPKNLGPPGTEQYSDPEYYKNAKW